MHENLKKLFDAYPKDFEIITAKRLRSPRIRRLKQFALLQDKVGIEMSLKAVKKHCDYEKLADTRLYNVIKVIEELENIVHGTGKPESTEAT
jgi:hypothetical protein